MNKRSILTLLFGAILMAACASPVAPTTISSGDISTTSQMTDGAKLNLNTVSGDELTAGIPNFPSRMIREFQEYRPYVSIQQFRKEIGKYVDDSQLAEYEKYVYVPISYNISDSATLQQIPGLDATEAEALIAGRPYGTQGDFLTKLSEHISTDEVEIAKTYLGDN